MVDRKLVFIGMANILLFGCTIAFVWSAAQSNYSVAKPWVLEFSPSGPSVKIDKFDLTGSYDPQTNTYGNMRVFLVNLGEEDIGAKIYVVFLDKDMSVICEGISDTPTIATLGTYDLHVDLNWVPGASASEIMLIRIVVEEFRGVV